MVETGQTHVPCGGSEGVGTVEDVIHHEELGAVEDDPGDVADEEHHHDTDEHSGQVQLSSCCSVVDCLFVRISV